MKTTRAWVAMIVLVVSLAAFYFRALPFLSPTADYITSSITSSLQKTFPPASFCMKDIGDDLCCQLHLGAEPCLDECRKNFMDRQTFQPTKEYDVCADQCLVLYESTCGTRHREWDSSDSASTSSSNDSQNPRRRRRHVV